MKEDTEQNWLNAVSNSDCLHKQASDGDLQKSRGEWVVEE